jgi:hypothetical protein
MDREGWSGLERGEDRCAACARAIGAEEPAFAALFPQDGGFRRRDYCLACFRALAERPVSFWKRAPRKAAPEADEKAKGARRRRDLDALSELFDRLSAPDDAPDAKKVPEEERQKLRYLLALALVRKRRLELVELARAGGADCLVLRSSGAAELVTVPAPRLSEEDLARLSRELEAEVGLS